MTGTSITVADRTAALPGGAGLDRRHRAAVADVPVLEPGAGGPSERFAQALSGRHPVTVFMLASILGYVLLAALTIAVGLFLTEVVLRSGGVAGADEGFVGWLAAHRDPTRTEASLIASIMAGGVVIPTVVGVAAAVLACFRRWRIAAFLVAAIAVEAATYRTTTLVVHRDRPHVPRLEHLPTNASFPSGHTAASVAVYCGLALLLTSRIRTTWVTVVCWTIALAIPPYVAMGRMYRGMHHPLDALAGVAIGIAALLVALFAARAAGYAARERDAERMRSGSES